MRVSSRYHLWWRCEPAWKCAKDGNVKYTNNCTWKAQILWSLQTKYLRMTTQYWNEISDVIPNFSWLADFCNEPEIIQIDFNNFRNNFTTREMCVQRHLSLLLIEREFLLISYWNYKDTRREITQSCLHYRVQLMPCFLFVEHLDGNSPCVFIEYWTFSYKLCFIVVI